jgi:hypothetical protein
MKRTFNGEEKGALMKYFLSLIAILVFPFTFLSAENPRTIKIISIAV